MRGVLLRTVGVAPFKSTAGNRSPLRGSSGQIACLCTSGALSDRLPTIFVVLTRAIPKRSEDCTQSTKQASHHTIKIVRVPMHRVRTRSWHICVWPQCTGTLIFVMQKKRPALNAIKMAFPGAGCWVDCEGVVTLRAHPLRRPSLITYTCELAGCRLVRGHGERANRLCGK